LPLSKILSLVNKKMPSIETFSQTERDIYEKILRKEVAMGVRQGVGMDSLKFYPKLCFINLK
jgi:hypothetical protein